VTRRWPRNCGATRGHQADRRVRHAWCRSAVCGTSRQTKHRAKWKEIARNRAEWAKDMHRKLPDRIAQLYAQMQSSSRPMGSSLWADPRSLPAGYGEIPPAICISPASQVSLTYDTGDVDESRIPVVGGATQQSRGAYLTISRRTNGAWLIAEQVWTGQTAAEH
jgi:hypothetical protein